LTEALRAFTALLDDAAVFPPGNLPLAEAVNAHHGHRRSAYAELVGPLVLPAAALAGWRRCWRRARRRWRSA
jgi:hypothetical protein